MNPPNRALALWTGRASATVLLVCALVMMGCTTRRYEVGYRTLPPVPSQHFMAAAADVDITPPPGLPLFGYSLPAEKHARGYQSRLRARAIVLQDRSGQRLALVQVDLGAMSALLHRRVAEATAAIGIGPDRLLLSATHTHAGPGGFFGASFYNYMGSPRAGFDASLVDFLVERIAGAVRTAASRLEPARVGFGQSSLHGSVSMVRSRAGQPGVALDDSVRLLRVDAGSQGAQRPLAVFAVFAVHGTAVSASARVYHGDLFATASRELARELTPRGQDRAVIVAIANGTEGDVAPRRRPRQKQGFRLAAQRGSDLARGAVAAFERAGRNLRDDITLQHGYWERNVDSPRADGQPALCATPVVGVATLGGSEDGRSPLYGKFGIYEGHRRQRPRGCHGYKLPAFGRMGASLLGEPQRWNPRTPQVSQLLQLPRVMPFQLMRIGDFVAATVPGEPTGQVGRDARAAIQAGLGLDSADAIAVVGLANGYVGYFTAAGEYAHQHYEGASTFYGPGQGAFASESLGRIARAMATPGARAVSAYPVRRFETGPDADLWPDASKPLPEPAWRVISTSRGGSEALMIWDGRAAGQDGVAPPARVFVECTAIDQRLGPMSEVDDDDGPDMRVWVDAEGERNRWTARWRPSQRIVARGQRRRCRFGVERASMPPLWSSGFEATR